MFDRIGNHERSDMLYNNFLFCVADHPKDKFRCGPCGGEIHGGIINVIEHLKNCQAREEERGM